MFWIRIISKILAALKDGGTPNQLAAGFTLGFIIGLIPGWPLHVMVIFALVLIFSVNLSLALIGMTIAAVVALALDPVLDQIGGAVLSIEAFQGLFTVLFNNPFLMISRFNNSLVMGGTVLGFIVALPVFFLSRVGVIQYREKFLEAFAKWKVVKALKSSFLGPFIMKILSMQEG